MTYSVVWVLPKEDRIMEIISIDEIRNYDVLVIKKIPSRPEKSNDSSGELADLYEEKEENEAGKATIEFYDSDHVGNNRLRVMLSIPSNGQESSDEISYISRRVVNSICHECEPPGRFLQWQDGENNFANLGDGDDAVEVVRGLLQGQDTSFKYETYTEEETPKESLEDRTDQLTSSVKSIDLADRRFSVSGVFKFASRMRSGRNLTEKHSTDKEKPETTDSDSGDEKKRPRRPSLLRRSLDLTRTIFKSGEKSDDTGKKKFRLGLSRRNSKTSLKDITSYSKGRDIQTSDLNEYDVLTTFTPIFSILPTDNVGNNRIRVMMDMQRQRYNNPNTTDEEKYVIAKEIYSHTIQGGFSGRFVTKSEVKKDTHVELTENLAIGVVSWCLDSTKPQYHKSNSIADLSEPEPATEYSFDSEKTLFTKNDSTPDLIISTSNPALDDQEQKKGNGITSSLKEMRSAALQSLKIRKQKKIVLSTLGGNKIEELQRYVKVNDTTGTDSKMMQP